jgi:hypothetical protein
MIKQLLSAVALAFLLGWVTHAVIGDLAGTAQNQVLGEQILKPSVSASLSEPAHPVSPEPKPQNIRLERLDEPVEFEDAGREKPSPSDRLTVNQVHVTSTRVTIDGISGREFETAIFTNTNSMDPLIDEGSQALQIIPKTPEEIKVGDVISYDAGTYGTIIHRVISIGKDENGWYATVKGDNNNSPDPFKVRFSMVKRVLVGVLY